MSSRRWVLAGLLSGMVTGLAVLALVVALGPEPGTDRATSTPPPVPTAVGTPSVGPTGAAASPASPAGPGGSPTITPSPPATATVMHIGQPAPVLVVPQVGGGTIDLATLRGQPVWVTFFETSCSACVPELTAMNGFAGRYASTGLVVLAVGVRDDEGAVANFARRAAATFPFGLDLDGSAQQEWDAPALPAHYWMEPNGTVRDAATGVLGAETMARSLGRILPGVDVRP